MWPNISYQQHYGILKASILFTAFTLRYMISINILQQTHLHKEITMHVLLMHKTN